jgi:cell division protein FtsB
MTGRIAARALCLIFAFQMLLAVFGDRGLLVLQTARQDEAALRARIEAMRQENVRLQGRIRRLREDPSAIEEIARQELGLIKPGEVVFIVRDLPAQ